MFSMPILLIRIGPTRLNIRICAIRMLKIRIQGVSRATFPQKGIEGHDFPKKGILVHHPIMHIFITFASM